MKTHLWALIFGMLAPVASAAEAPTPTQVLTAMKKAAVCFCNKAAAHGGYVYYWSADFSQRWGEGKATMDQIFVQPPGTPAVGMAFLKAFAATGDDYYLQAAREAAEALVHGQLESGGWTQTVDFDPAGTKVSQYRNGKGRGRNHSTLDDGISQSALRFLMHADRALGFKHAAIHEAESFAREALLAAQHPNGGFPQVWMGPAPKYPAVKAAFPDYDWRTVNRIKDYWDLPTLNDGLAGTVAQVLEDGWSIYKDARCRQALARLGDFLLLAQLPEPQPGWAQQYDRQMRPVWARKFEPPAVAGRESQDAIMTLLQVAGMTGDAKYIETIPRALAWLKRSQLPDGQLARFYELGSNKPLYMTADYQLTHSDSDLPKHYGWKTESKAVALELAYQAAKVGKTPAASPAVARQEQIATIIRELDADGRWVSTYEGEPLVGQPKFSPGTKFIAAEVFNRNLEALSEYIATRSAK